MNNKHTSSVLSNLRFKQDLRRRLWHDGLEKATTEELVRVNAELLSNLFHRQNVLKHLRVGSMQFQSTLTRDQQATVDAQARRLVVDRTKLIGEIKKLVDDYHKVEGEVVELFGARLGLEPRSWGNQAA